MATDPPYSESLRVRYFSMATCPRGSWFSVGPCLTLCGRLAPTIRDLDDRRLPRLLGSLLASIRPQVCIVPHRRLH